MNNKKLFICEKPSQAKDLAKFLKANKKGAGYFYNEELIVTYLFGHLIVSYEPGDYDYERWGKFNLEHMPFIPEKWMDKPNPEPSREKQLNVVGELLKGTNHVVIATDYDREGELLGVEVLEYFNFKGKRERMKLRSLDPVSLQRAYDSIVPASETYPLYLAGLGKKRADQMVGISLTVAMTKANEGKIEGFLSYGRVQSAVLRIIWDNEQAIKNFVSKTFYELESTFDANGDKYTAHYQIPEELTDENGYILDRKIIEDELAKNSSQTPIINKLEKTKKKTEPPLPYSLKKIQGEAFKKYGYDVGDTLKTLQALYETHKICSYPRTDCEYIPETQFSDAGDIINAIQNNLAEEDFVEKSKPLIDLKFKSKSWNDKKITAHHAIIPTVLDYDMSKLTPQEANLYKMVCENYISQFLGLYEYEHTLLETKQGSMVYKTTGNITLRQGWKSIIKSSDDKTLPNVVEGQEVELVKYDIKEKKTQPPKRFTQATLLNAMENAGKFTDNPEYKKKLKDVKGIGTPATQSTIIQKIFDRGYVVAKKKNIHLTEKGDIAIILAPEKIKTPEITAYWEMQLSKVESGELSLDDFLEEQKQVTIDIINDIKAGKHTIDQPIGIKHKCPKCGSGLRKIKSKKNNKNYWVCTSNKCDTIINDNRGKPAKIEIIDQGDKEHFCEKCNRKLIRRKSKNGNFFWGCSGWSDKDNPCKAIYLDENCAPGKLWEKKTSEHKCPNCKDGRLVRREGAKGPFWGCNNYPKCKTTLPDDDGKPGEAKTKQTSDYKCPNCKEGYLILRKGPKGPFWGCNNYPKCKTTFQNDDGKPKGLEENT